MNLTHYREGVEWNEKSKFRQIEDTEIYIEFNAF